MKGKEICANKKTGSLICSLWPSVFFVAVFFSFFHIYCEILKLTFFPHRQEKPFKAQYMLVVHMRRHTGEKPHKCTVSFFINIGFLELGARYPVFPFPHFTESFIWPAMYGIFYLHIYIFILIFIFSLYTWLSRFLWILKTILLVWYYCFHKWLPIFDNLVEVKSLNLSPK